MRFVSRFLTNQQGQALVEYAYILLFVSVAAVGVLTVLGENVLDLLDRYPWR